MLFKRNSDVYQNAFPNWQKNFMENDEYFSLYATHFKKAADQLILSIESNNGHIADTLINPAIYLYRHSIELSLKAILYKNYFDQKLDPEKIIEKLDGHNLQSLWDKANNEIRANYNFVSTQAHKNELKKLGELISELNLTDTGSMNYRYPFDKELVEFVQGDGKESFGIDYINMMQEFEYLHNRLNDWIYESLVLSSENQE
ncbi:MULTISPECIES: hypothetical protein [unclassified Exiguobacterium]|uniref:hypothetical protein n=1 Tax=unclassified Exiguobacterium TaxID=2644629 RepID=UPI001BE71F7D|nr:MULTISPECIES: hypothetical protein [unclassified Exiguobacterium]